MSSKSTSKYRVFYGACWLVFVDRGKRKGMICDVLYLAASNVIESLSTKMFAVLEILLLPLFCIIVR